MSGEVVSTVVDRVIRDRAARWLGRVGVRLPTFAELADPSRIPESTQGDVAVRRLRIVPIRQISFACIGTTTPPE